MGYRVVQWGTGNVGRHALRCIIGHPDLELVGVWVHGDDKVGKDAGELCGVGPVGVLATNDADELMAMRADCVSYMATGDLRPNEAVEDMCRILETGSNVVSTSVVPLVYPPTADPRAAARLEEACRVGGTSCFTSGIDPGFANDLLPLTLLGACERVDSVRVMEILNYDTYDQAEVLFETMGFGQALDSTPLLLFPGALTFAWGGVVSMIAEGLGVELDEIRETHERRPAETTFDIAAGRVEAGTTAALRFEVQGIVNGRPAIVVEHVTRLHDALAPDWPQPAGHGSYRILIEGSPSLKCELELSDTAGDHNAAGLTVTAMRLLNAIPAVCEAEPGLLSTLDLPLVTGRHVMR
ncbi:MAG: diacylglycerol kinase [Actinobacteria bacterium]|nr:MAG: diacylglycerol kinase [Actinomycetota bacterium]